jgi:hypothetical protein
LTYFFPAGVSDVADSWIPVLQKGFALPVLKRSLSFPHRSVPVAAVHFLRVKIISAATVWVAVFHLSVVVLCLRTVSQYAHC